MKLKPSFEYETVFVNQGYALVAGIDEAGRAPLAGPVSAGAVILDTAAAGRWLDEVRDSKMLSKSKREYLEPYIKDNAVSFGVGFSSCREIDAFGIVRATRIAMSRALHQLLPQPQALLIDYLRLPEVNLPQQGVLHGDGLCLSIACASILAKVARDRLMDEMDLLYPLYGFARNKGYPTPEHFCSLQKHGPCPIHRNSFGPLKARLELVYDD